VQLTPPLIENENNIPPCPQNSLLIDISSNNKINTSPKGDHSKYGKYKPMQWTIEVS